MSVRILTGDCREILRTLPAESVHCVVTSPPYWGLRDYGTAKWAVQSKGDPDPQWYVCEDCGIVRHIRDLKSGCPQCGQTMIPWEGGDPGCDHRKVQDAAFAVASSGLKGGKKSTGHLQEGYKEKCARCGARRSDSQIGLESSFTDYVAVMVEVFREVKRVLRKDGTCWVNLGTSYASGDMNPSQSPLLWRAPAYGNGGKESSCSRAPDYACPDQHGEYRGGYGSHRGCIVGNGQHLQQGAQLGGLKGHNSGQTALSGAAASLRDAPASTTRASSDYAQDAFCQEDEASASQQSLLTSLFDVHQSERNSACTDDTVPRSPPLVVRTSGKESFFSACGKFDCKGVGQCGLCFVYLSIPSLTLKAKDEVNAPHFVAMAIQADGWFLRSTIVWSKLNPMPESVTDRPTKAHEYLFLLTKSPTYFYDAEAIREPQTSPDNSDNPNSRSGVSRDEYEAVRPGGPLTRERIPMRDRIWNPAGRNRRTVWEIATSPFPEAHFATFSPALVEPCIKAGTSEKGVCGKCGAPWVRKVEKSGGTIGKSWHNHENDLGRGQRGGDDGNAAADLYHTYRVATVGFSPSCSCKNADVVPATILDPFGGAGTSGLVTDRLGRNAVLIELNPEYANMARMRLEKDAGLFAQVAVE